MVEALDVSATTASEKEIELYHDVSEKCTAYADYYMVTTILRNLISNAVKFTAQKGRIDIICKTMQLNNNDFVEIAVVDSGIGISEKN